GFDMDHLRVVVPGSGRRRDAASLHRGRLASTRGAVGDLARARSGLHSCGTAPDSHRTSLPPAAARRRGLFASLVRVLTSGVTLPPVVGPCACGYGGGDQNTIPEQRRDERAVGPVGRWHHGCRRGGGVAAQARGRGPAYPA